MAVGCSHGHLEHPKIIKQVLEFRKRFAPEIRFHLGDIVDTAAFRSGARGTKDEAENPTSDQVAGVRLLLNYEPTHICWGNHDVRLLDLAQHPNGIVSYAATTLWNELVGVAEQLKARTVPYDIKRGWFHLGGVHWGHGYMYNVNALRDHAEMCQGPVVMAHTHQPSAAPGRTLRDSWSYSVGLLADAERMSYARRRRQTLAWGHGIVYGEICQDSAQLHLIQSEAGQPLHIPNWL